MKQNLREFDFLRAIAALMVIGIHVSSGRININKIAYILDLSMVCAVPIFIITSGYLLHYSYKDREELNYFVFLKKRLSKVLIPYLIWAFIYMSYTSSYKILSIKFFKTLFLNIILGRGLGHLYFMVIILQLYMIYPLLRKVIIKNINATLAVSFCISFYFQMAPYFQLHRVNILPVCGTPYYFIFFGRWLFYFVFGMYMSSSSLMSAISKNKLNLFIVWIPLNTSIIILSKQLNMGAPILNPLTIIYNIVSFLFLYSICQSFKETKSKSGDFLYWVSRQSFIFYLSHLIIIKLTLLKISKIGSIYIWEGTRGLILFYLSAVLLTSVFSYLISLTPAAVLFGGVRRVRKIKDNTNVNLNA